jgi:hypothetical protein
MLYTEMLKPGNDVKCLIHDESAEFRRMTFFDLQNIG